MSDEIVRTVFISYARESDAHNDWVNQLADAIEELPDFTVVFDQYDLHAGKDLTYFMEKGLRCDRIIVVITPEYVRKATARTGGVGYESSVISADLLADQLSDRIVPVVRSGSERPAFLRSKLFVDCRNDERYDLSIAELRRALLGSAMATRPSKNSGDENALWAGLDRYAFTEQPEDPEYTLESFVPCASSRVALAACIAAARTPGRVYNPLFLFGRQATGKTHLLHAIAQELRQQHLQVLRLTVEGFVKRLINAIRYDRMNVFRRFIRSADAFLLDDVQFLAGKERTQEEIFHCLNDLAERHAQIVLTCDTPPIDIATLDERVRSRFDGGLIVEVGAPNVPAYVEIGRRHAIKQGVELADEVLTFIAGHVSGGVRQLQGVINRMAAETRAADQVIDISRARDLLRIAVPSKREWKSREVIGTIAKYFGTTVEAMKGQKRNKATAYARRIAFYTLQELCGLTIPAIAAIFHCGPAIVRRDIDSITERLEADQSLADTIGSLGEEFRRLPGVRSLPGVMLRRW
jgi:chromosomal replication initiator protein